MKPPPDSEDEELDRIWRARFGQPLPILRCGGLVRELLARQSARIESEEARGPTP